LRKETKVRLNVYSSLLLAIITTVIIIQFRTVRMTGDEAAGYFDGSLQSLHETAELALAKHKDGSPVLKEVVTIAMRGRQLRKLHRRIAWRLQRTERTLKRINAPEEMMGRQRLFAAEFEHNARSLFRMVRSVTGQYWRSYFGKGHRGQFREELEGLVAFLKEKEPGLVDIPLDPMKLPHRSVQGANLPCLEYSEGAVEPGIPMQKPPSGQDLAQTDEVEFSGQIRTLARKLEKSPIQILAYVRDSLDYEPYYGSLKGSNRTLMEKAGNDFDLASLLVSLLRSSGIPSRYAYGEIVVPIEDLMGWVGGMKAASTAARILSANRIPATVLTIDGDTVAVRMEHCWVEAFVDDARWVALDPSFRRYVYREGLEVAQDVAFDEKAYLGFLSSQSLLKRLFPFVGSRTPVRGGIPSPGTFFLEAVDRAVGESYPDSSAFCVAGHPESDRGSPKALPEVLPYDQHGTAERFSEIPDVLRHKLVFEVVERDGKVSVSYSVSTAQLADNYVLLAHLPATQNDYRMAEAYGNINSPPAYVVEVKPHLFVSGESVASGTPIRFGESQVFEIGFVFPREGETDRVKIEAVVGAAYCPVFDFQRISEELFSEFADDIDTLIKERLKSEEGPVVVEPQKLGRFLHGLGLRYFLKLDSCEVMLRDFLDIVNSREVSMFMVIGDVDVSYLFGVPYDVDAGGLRVDMHRIINKPFSVFGERGREVEFNLISGYESSYLVQEIVEYWGGVPSVDALEVLQIANQRAVPVHTIDSNNLAKFMPRLDLSEPIKRTVADLANAGRTVTVPERELAIGRHMRIGYVGLDPISGDGVYKVRRERDAPTLPPGSIRLILEYSSVLITAVAAAIATQRIRRRRREREWRGAMRARDKRQDDWKTRDQ
jgi:hypothetical protein